VHLSSKDPMNDNDEIGVFIIRTLTIAVRKRECVSFAVWVRDR
jgi:hypothetical protein